MKYPRSRVCKIRHLLLGTVKILKIAAPKLVTIFDLIMGQFDITMRYCIQKMPMKWQTM